MKQCLIVAFCLVCSINVFANQKAQEAADAYAKRGYDAAGVKNATQAAALYADAVAAETDKMAKLNLMLDQASAHYFLGTSMEVKKERMAQHQAAMDVADTIMTEFGVAPKTAHEMSEDQVNTLLGQLSDAEELIVADAMYSKGINLAQWGNLKGIFASLDKLPIVLGLMERIEMMGQESISEYGPYRTIGRIKFKLPGIAGGDIKESAKYLGRAFAKTLVEGQRYSVNAYNNLYLAETLYKQGKETKAIELLELLVSADPTTLKKNSDPENAKAVETAQELLSDWK